MVLATCLAVLSELRYSFRSLARAPALAATLVLTIALGIGSNAAVHGFVRGLVVREMPLADKEHVLSVVGVDADGTGPLSFEDYLAVKAYDDVFEWVGAARESPATIGTDGRSSLVPSAAVTSEIASFFQLALDDRVIISRRLRQNELRPALDAGTSTIRLDDVDARVSAVAPDWLDGLFVGRGVDVWIPWDQAWDHDFDPASRAVWVLARLRAGISVARAEARINDGRRAGVGLRLFPYTGMLPDMAHGLSRIATLLGISAAAVFAIAAANVSCLLLSRAAARSRETAVRVALGARRAQLVRQLLADSVLISVAGGALGVVLARWTTNLVPLLFFDRDAAQLAFAPNQTGIIVASAACLSVTLACGLMPLFEMRDDRPAAVLQRESAGPSPSMRRLRTGLVVAQIALCCMLVIATGLLWESFRSALHTNVDQRLGAPILATIQSRPRMSRGETTSTGIEFFRAVEEAAGAVPGVTPRAWVATLPGGLPAWQRFQVEPSEMPLREEEIDVAPFTPATLAHIKVPPLAGRLFGGQDTARACRVAIVNEAAARAVFGGNAVGRSIGDPAGKSVEIVGVVAAGQAEDASDRMRPTIYYFADQTSIPVPTAGPGRFVIPAPAKSSTALLDSNVVSANYFAAMGWAMHEGQPFAGDPGHSCRVAVVNREAAEQYFGGKAVGAAVIDRAGRRTTITGVVQAAPLRALQRRPEPAIYFPLTQDFLPGMTLILAARDTSDAVLADVRRRLTAVPGRGPSPVVVRTLDAHLRQTALAPLRIATILVGASAAIALTLGTLGLYGALSDSARRQRREIAVRIALGAQGWRLVRQVMSEGMRLAAAGTAAGMLASLLVARSLAAIAPHDGSAIWAWAIAPLLLIGAVACASVIPVRRALAADPIAITRADN